MKPIHMTVLDSRDTKTETLKPASWRGCLSLHQIQHKTQRMSHGMLVCTSFSGISHWGWGTAAMRALSQISSSTYVCHIYKITNNKSFVKL